MLLAGKTYCQIHSFPTFGCFLAKAGQNLTNASCLKRIERMYIRTSTERRRSDTLDSSLRGNDRIEIVHTAVADVDVEASGRRCLFFGGSRIVPFFDAMSILPAVKMQSAWSIEHGEKQGQKRKHKRAVRIELCEYLSAKHENKFKNRKP
jgi:hypothetical protein